MVKRKRNVRRKSSRKKRMSGKGKRSLVTKTQLYRAIRRNVETKIVSIEYPLTSFNAGISSIADLIAILPSMAQGIGQNQRIGNTVKPLKLVVRGYITYNMQEASLLADARMLGVRLFCLQDRSSSAYNNNIFNFNLLDLGGATTPFTGAAINFSSPVNKEQFKVFADKKFRILKPYGNTNGTAPYSLAVDAMHSSLYHPFTIVLGAKHLPSTLKYDLTDSINNPVNFAPVLGLGYCDLMGVAPDTTTTQLKMQFVSTLYYEDA